MRLFPGDDVAGLSAFAEEMRAPWIIPPAFPRLHRRRLAVLVGRAVRTFDPRVRFIELRWADRWLLTQGSLHLPPRVLIWWRVSSITGAPAEVLVEAPRLVPGHHLFDFETDPGVSSLGWMGPLKVRLLEKITEVLVDERPLHERDIEPVLDALDDAAKTVESPIDLLDFVERLFAQYASGLGLSEARADAIAAVIASRFGVGSAAYADMTQTMEALTAAHRGEPLSAVAHGFLVAAGLSERSTEVSSPWMTWIRHPGVLDRIEQQLRAGRRPSDQPPPLRPKESAMAAAVPAASSLEAAAEGVLRDLRAGADSHWDGRRKQKAARTLFDLASQLEEERKGSFERAALERSAVLLETAGTLAASARPAMAIDALIRAASHYQDADELERATDLIMRAWELAEAEGDPGHRASVLRAKGALALRKDDLATAREAYDAALRLFRGHQDRQGEANVLLCKAQLTLRMHELSIAGEACDAALALFHELQNRQGEANVLQVKGNLAMRTDDLTAAKEAYDTALPLYRETQDRLGEANVLNAKGYLAMRMHDLAAAKEAYDAALSLFREIGDRLGEANVLQSKGGLAMRTRDLAAAREAYDAALLLYRETQHRLGEANVLNAKGHLALSLHDLAIAKEAYNAALLLHRDVGSRLGQANSLRGLGVAGALEGEGVADNLQASAEMAEAIQDNIGRWSSLALMAAISGRPPTAFEGALAFFSSAGLRWEATLVEALRHAVSGDVRRAAEALRASPEGESLVEDIAVLDPREAVNRLMVLLVTS